MADIECLQIRKAKIEDYQNIMDITKDEDLWLGLDYIPFALEAWLQESKQGGKRDNIVFTLDGNIVGFESFYFLNNGKSVARFAFRVKKQLRGKGYGRKMLSLQLNYLKEHHSEVVHTLSAIPDINLPDEAFTTQKFGDQLVKCAFINVKIDMSTYKITNQIDSSEQLTVLDKSQFASILQSKGSIKLLEKGCLHMNWVPILPHTPDDIEFAARKDAQVLIEGSLENPQSLSILTSPFPCPIGVRGGIDVLASTNESCKKHILNQMKNLFGSAMLSSKMSPSQILVLQIFVSKNQVDTTLECLELFGLKDSIFTLSESRFNRKTDTMYVYKDNLHK